MSYRTPVKVLEQIDSTFLCLVTSNEMSPNAAFGDRFLIDELATPREGDFVLVKRPVDDINFVDELEIFDPDSNGVISGVAIEHHKRLRIA